MLTAVFTVISRQLVITFDRDVLVSPAFTALNLIVYSGTNRYNWNNTVSVIGAVITTQQAVAVVDATPQNLVYTPPPLSVIDKSGAPWSAGAYIVTVI